MPDLYNPALPGVVKNLPDGWRRSGWVDWDQLTEEQQAAHEAALPHNDEPGSVAASPAPDAEQPSETDKRRKPATTPKE